jgi:hypothetical protein
MFLIVSGEVGVFLEYSPEQIEKQRAEMQRLSKIYLSNHQKYTDQRLLDSLDFPKTKELIQILKETGNHCQELMSLLCNFNFVDFWKKEQLWLLCSPRKEKYYDDLAIRYYKIEHTIKSGRITGDDSLKYKKPCVR